VLYWHGCSAAWGLRNFWIIDAVFRLIKTRKQNRRMDTKEARTDLNCKASGKNPLVELFKDVLIRERRDKWYLCPVVSLFQSFFGELVVFVCKKE